MKYTNLVSSDVVKTPADDGSGSRLRGLAHRKSTMVYSILLLTVPMTVLTAVLLSLIFTRRVFPQESVYGNLRLNKTSADTGIVYVDLSSTQLLFVASWSSSLAPILVGSALTLTSFPIARRFHQHVTKQEIQLLPTPYQTALLLQFLGGGSLGALWEWIKYRFARRNRNETPVASLSILALMTSCMAFLSAIVFLTDTWLHIVTKTVPLTQVSPVKTNTDYSMALLPQCTDVTSSAANASLLECAIIIGTSSTYFVNGTEPLLVLNNISDTMEVSTYDNTYAYLGVPLSDEVSQRDYTATTFGIETYCKPITQACHLDGTSVGAVAPYNCSDTFQGDVYTSPLTVAFFPDEQMSSNATLLPVNNPFYFGMAINANAIGNTSADTTAALRNDPEIVTPENGGVALILLCNSTVYDVVYDSVNKTIVRFETTPSNLSVTNLWQGSISYASYGGVLPPDAFGYNALGQAVSVAALSNSAEEIAGKVAPAFSRIALAAGSSTVQPQSAIVAQERNTFLVARVPMAPLFTLIASNMLYVILGIILAALAITNSTDTTREIQARMSIAGLTANYFEGRRARMKVESLDQLFAENDGVGSMRVAIHRTPEGGYEYQAFSKELIDN